MTTGLQISTRDGIGRAVLENGASNTVDGEICAALSGYLHDPPDDAHVLVISARGPAFCLGRERQGHTLDELRAEVSALVELNLALTTARLITVAQVHGDAAGFGVGLAALCDVTIAAPSARFWFPEVELGLAPAVVLAWLPRLVGHKRALHLAATGKTLTAAEAAEIGLVTRVASAGDALEATVEEEVAALAKHSSRVHAEIKQFLNATADQSEANAYDLAIEKLIIGSLDGSMTTAVREPMQQR
ncbi:MAG: enoyl-CoA hydratase/isomerase family protein [Propionibacteriales bacterium]|nr:enoyl-CoA hydratase/isomerase family protein [Propionibacteriales bacterium]